MKNVSVVVQYPHYQGDRLFTDPDCLPGSHAGNPQWLQPFYELRKRCEASGINIHTSDVLAPEASDIVFYMEPPRRSLVEELRSRSRSIRHVLMLIESPLHCPYMDNKKNLDIFDRVLTYDARRCSSSKMRHYWLPLAEEIEKPTETPFESRKSSVLISSNQSYGFYKKLLTIRRALREGWVVDLKCISRMLRFKELYSVRRKIVNEFERNNSTKLDVYGPGWSKSKLCRGDKSGNKLKLLSSYRFNICLENVIDDCGYISEKIFDCFLAGTVPIYLGDKRIASMVPCDAYVDARLFSDWTQLVEYVSSCDEKTWEKMKAAGERYLNGGQIRPFLANTFCDHVLSTFA